MVLLIAGSRDFNDYNTLSRVCDKILEKYNPCDVTIVSGGARGADTLAIHYAKNKHTKLRIFPAQWDVYGKSAGYRRNEEMQQYIAKFPNRMVICFWDGISRGTQHNFGLCEKYNTPLKVFLYKENRFM